MKIFSNVAVALAATVIFPAAGIAAAGTTAGSAATPSVVRNAVLFYAFDRNGDGAVDRSEADAMRVVIFAVLDANGDGRVTQQEAGAVLLPSKAGAKDKKTQKIAKKRQDLLVSLDLAKPEGVPKDEFVGRNAAIFTKADTNQDGKIDRTEFVVLLDGFGGVLP